MKQTTLSRWLQCVLVMAGLCGLLLDALVFPSMGQSLATQYPEFAHCYVPWLVFLWTASLPCFAALVLAFRVTRSIGQDRSFTEKNARLLGWISVLAVMDSLFFLAGNIVLLLWNKNHPGILLGSLMLVFLGLAVAVAAATLSHLVKKAAALQEQSDWTV